MLTLARYPAPTESRVGLQHRVPVAYFGLWEAFGKSKVRVTQENGSLAFILR